MDLKPYFPATILQNAKVPVLGIAAFSGTGKTTLLVKLLPLLREQGYRVAVIKHAHHQFDIDQPGKDSHKLRLAGADQLVVASSKRFALMVESDVGDAAGNNIDLDALIWHFDQDKLDLILVEGFKWSPIPKIELHRAVLGHPLLCDNDPDIVAIAWDRPVVLARKIPSFDLNRTASIAEFIVNWLLKGNAKMNLNSSKLLTIVEAQQLIEGLMQPLQGEETVTLNNALGRTIASDITSPVNVPPHTNSAMDGYAINLSDFLNGGTTLLPIVGKSFAGKPFVGVLKPGECIRIMTGAVLPDGADTVVIQEDVTCEGDAIRFVDGQKKGQHIRAVADDIAIGDVILTKGKLLRPAELGVLASLGIANIAVVRKLRVAFFSTGDELRNPGESLRTGDIYESNRPVIHGMLMQLGVDAIDMGIVIDNKEDIQKAFKTAAHMADVVITSGGVSVGEADYVKETLEELGEVAFWKLAIKPGKPLAFGRIDDALFFGLPGNPVSVMATFYQIVQPALRRLMGQMINPPVRFSAVCKNDLRKKPGRVDFQRGFVMADENGQVSVKSAGGQGSHQLSSMSRANCFIVLPQECSGVESGSYVDVEPFYGLVGVS